MSGNFQRKTLSGSFVFQFAISGNIFVNSRIACDLDLTPDAVNTDNFA